MVAKLVIIIIIVVMQMRWIFNLVAKPRSINYVQQGCVSCAATNNVSQTYIGCNDAIRLSMEIWLTAKPPILSISRAFSTGVHTGSRNISR